MNLENNQSNSQNGLSIQTSILAGALIIAISIVYAAHAGGVVSRTTTNDDTPAAIKVEKRKDAPTEGKGKVEIVEFSDFECPFCAKFWNETYATLKAKYVDTGKVTLTYRHLPLASIHPYAPKAAEAAECANRQGKFWQYHDKLFSVFTQDGSGLAVSNLKTYAQNVGLDTDKFNSCLDNGETTEVVNTDLKEASRLGISATPTFFINGIKVIGAQPVSVFEQIIDAELKK